MPRRRQTGWLGRLRLLAILATIAGVVAPASLVPGVARRPSEPGSPAAPLVAMATPRDATDPLDGAGRAEGEESGLPDPAPDDGSNEAEEAPEGPAYAGPRRAVERPRWAVTQNRFDPPASAPRPASPRAAASRPIFAVGLPTLLCRPLC